MLLAIYLAHKSEILTGIAEWDKGVTPWRFCLGVSLLIFIGWLGNRYRLWLNERFSNLETSRTRYNKDIIAPWIKATADLEAKIARIESTLGHGEER